MIKEFHKPQTIDEAVALKARLGPSSAFLAGGTQVNSLGFSPAPEQVISLEALPLRDIRATDSTLSLGACCTIQELADAAEVPPPIRAAALHNVNRLLRNAATVGGEIAANKSHSHLIPILVAAQAQILAIGHDGSRTIPIADYLASPGQWLITEIQVPRMVPPRLAAVARYVRAANDLPILTAAATMNRQADRMINPVIAVGGVGDRVIRLQAIETKLNNAPMPVREDLEKWAADQVSPVADIHGSVAFKKYMAGVLVATTVCQAFQGEGGQI